MKKNKWLAYLFATLCTGAMLFLLFSLRLCTETGSLRVKVMDAYTFAPIPFASVCLPEAEVRAVTNENGIAAFSGIPIINTVYGNMPKKDHGETTVLVYAQGYLPFALFNAQVFPKSVRNGPNVYLFPEGTEDGLNVVSMIESPPEEYVKQLLEQYTPY